MINSLLDNILGYFKFLFRKEEEYVPIYPYSSDLSIRRDQIWKNLQVGLLFEDTGTFIPWDTKFYELDKYKEQRRDSGDRTNWYFGKHTVLNGYGGHLEAMKWVFKSRFNPVGEIYTRFGTDFEGQKVFNFLREHLTQTLGEPTKINLEDWGGFELGTIAWEYGKAQICLVAVEIFNVRYELSIGLINNPNNQ